MMVHNGAARFGKVWAHSLVRWGTLLALMLITCVVALAWLAIAKTQGHDALVETINRRNVNTADLTRSLTRSGPAGEDDNADAILATQEFFQLTNRPREAANLGADRSVVFVVNEAAHYSDLPKQFAPILRVDGDSVHVASEVRVMNDAVHHRTTVLIFKDLPQAFLRDAHTVEMLLPETGGNRAVLQWYTPIDYPDSVEQPAVLSLGLLLSLGAGLLAAISPCLLQLTAYYLPTLAGVSMDATGAGATGNGQRRRVILTGLLFVLGFTIPYTAGGALMGSMGQALAGSGLLSPTGPVVVGAGVVMIVMALVVAYRARAPLVCRMPLPGAMKRSHRLPFVTTFISGFAIATGCLACFGGAVLGVLLVYTGLLGNAMLGALAMLLFSLGLAIPFLIAAFSLSWVMPVAQKLQKLAPAIGLISAVVMLFFGLTMITGNYHVVSGYLFKWLPLG